MNKLLIVEDDKNLSSDLENQFSRNDFESTLSYDGLIAEKIAQRYEFDCIILDINIPGINGFKLSQKIREFGIQTPIIMLTAFGEVEDKLKGFESGADDYLSKPFYFQELLARVKVQIKRKEKTAYTSETVEIADLIINMNKKEVWRHNNPIKLTSREFSILAMLAKEKGKVVSKKELIQEIWNTQTEVSTNTIEVFINSLRNKIDKEFKIKLINTKIGFGYYISDTLYENQE